MSRIGKLPISVDSKVNVKIDGGHVTVKGPNGELSKDFGTKVTITNENNEIVVKPIDDSKESVSMWGTARAIINNMVQGVTVGFTRELEFNGVGYKAVVSGNSMTLNLGYSHPIEYPLPKGVEAKVQRNLISLTSCDKELLGFVAAKIRSFRKPEPYKGKGIKYVEEVIIRKAGKAGAKK